MGKFRLDSLLVQRGLAGSRSQAQRLIMAGQVRVDGQLAIKPATPVTSGARLEVDQGPRFISRGGEKLEAALEAFPVDVTGRVCADVGASTGGFTDCLLQHGAAKVYAIDVGKGILHWKLRNDPRLVVMEGTNARYVESLPEPVSLVTVDASFISLKILLPVVKLWFGSSKLNREERKDREGNTKLSALDELGGPQKDSGEIVALIKPQFEAGRADVSKGSGVIRDPEIHRQVLLEVLNSAGEQGFGVLGLIRSPLLGPKGNAEFLAWLGLGQGRLVITETIAKALGATSQIAPRRVERG